MKKLLFLVCFIPGLSFPHDIFIVHCAGGICPQGAPATNDLVIREIFALSNNESTKFADWVAYRVTRETIGTSASLDRDWEEDEYLDPDDTLEPDDYDGAFRGLNTDRGHQAPLASFAGTVFWRSTNILSNITPQKSDLNQGPWVDLESEVRDAVYDIGDLYIVTGPLYDDQEEQMELPESDEGHRVPTGYFKVVATPSGRVTAFLFDQDDPRDREYCDAIRPFEVVESTSGLTIFPGQPDWPTGSVSAELGCQE